MNHTVIPNEQQLIETLDMVRAGLRIIRLWMLGADQIDLLYYWPEHDEPELRDKFKKFLDGEKLK